jgi:hypothetical protein
MNCDKGVGIVFLSALAPLMRAAPPLAALLSASRADATILCAAATGAASEFVVNDCDRIFAHENSIFVNKKDADRRFRDLPIHLVDRNKSCFDRLTIC